MASPALPQHRGRTCLRPNTNLWPSDSHPAQCSVAVLSQIIFRNVSVTEALVGSSGAKAVCYVGQPLWDPRPWVASHRGHRTLWRAKQNLSTQLLPDACTPTPSPKTGSVPFSGDHLPWIPSFWGTISGRLCSVLWGTLRAGGSGRE